MLLLLKREYLAMVRAGTKTATIRPWKSCSLRPGDRLVFNTGIAVTLTRVRRCTFATLTDDDVRADGFTSRAALRRAVRAIYPHLTDDAPCVVLHFRKSRR